MNQLDCMSVDDILQLAQTDKHAALKAMRELTKEVNESFDCLEEMRRIYENRPEQATPEATMMYRSISELRRKLLLSRKTVRNAYEQIKRMK